MQVTEDLFSPKVIEELNSAISYAKSTPEVKLIYRPLDRSKLHLRTYADASFASNLDLSSQLGFIILLCDDSSRCHVLNFSSRKSRRKVCSIMAGETYAFTAAFDFAYILKHDLERIFMQPIALKMFTDSKQLFDVITRASHTAEKRLMIDVAAAREAYNNFEISNVGLVAGIDNPADGLTKPKLCKPLYELLRTGIDATPVAQWIIRKK